MMQLKLMLLKSSNWKNIGISFAFSIAALVTLLQLLSLVPFSPEMFSSNLDASWVAGLHIMFNQKAILGKDLIFTFGPLGFAYCSLYYEPTYLYCIGIWSYLIFAYYIAVWSIAIKITHDRLSSSLWSLTVISLTIALYSPDVFMFLLVILTLLSYYLLSGKSKIVTVSILITALAIISLIKFSVFIFAIVPLLVILIDQMIYQKKIPYFFLIYALSIICLWLVLQQSLYNFLIYFNRSFQMSIGYNEAMSTPISVWKFLEEIIVIILNVIFIIIVTNIKWCQDKIRCILPNLAIIIMCYIIYKAGHTRFDGHILLTFSFNFLLTIILIPLIWKYESRFIARVMYLFLMVCFFSLLLFGYGKYCNNILQPVYGFINTFHNIPKSMISSYNFFHKRKNFDYIYKQNLDKIQQQFPLPVCQGTTDIYPFHQTILIANGLEYTPRPIFQSYAAYTSELASINASFVNGNSAPKNIFFMIDPIDHRFPAMDDGLSWPELLTHYDIMGVSSNFLQLHKKSIPLAYKIQQIKEVTAHLGETIILPNVKTSLWVKINLKQTIIGKTSTILFPPTLINITLTTKDGKICTYRLIPKVAEAGFLLSPFLENQESFANFASPKWLQLLESKTVISIKITTISGIGDIGYVSPYSIEISRLDFPR